ncbi:MAG: DUF6807 family protein [Planctomycetota bacterium]|jgi:hypothetical protein
MNDFRNKFLMTTAVLAAFTILACCEPTKHQAGTVTLNPIEILETNQGFTIAEGKAKIMFYQRQHKSLNGKYSRANYIHPLYGLDGEILTEDFPADHLHQRGIFWAWHQVWLGDKKLGDSWTTKDFFWDVYDAKILDVDSQSRALQVHVHWKSPLWTDANGKQKAFVKEVTTIRIYRAQDDIRKIDFQISLIALADDVRIGGSEDDKGYGGFTTRIRLPDGLSFTGSNGNVEPQRTPVEAGPWLDFSGAFRKDGKVSGLAILCHDSSPGYPQPWILRRKGSAQNPVYPGRYPVLLSCEKPLALRYRLIIHRGDVRHVNLDKLQAEYNSERHWLFDNR